MISKLFNRVLFKAIRARNKSYYFEMEVFKISLEINLEKPQIFLGKLHVFNTNTNCIMDYVAMNEFCQRKPSLLCRSSEIYFLTCVGHSPQAIAPKTPHSCVSPVTSLPFGCICLYFLLGKIFEQLFVTASALSAIVFRTQLYVYFK